MALLKPIGCETSLDKSRKDEVKNSRADQGENAIIPSINILTLLELKGMCLTQMIGNLIH